MTSPVFNNENCDYETWMAHVSKKIHATVGLFVDDLPDFPSRDYYDDGLCSDDAAHDCLLEAGWDPSTEELSLEMF